IWLPIRYHRVLTAAPDYRSDTAMLAIAQAVTAVVDPDVKQLTPNRGAKPQIEPVAWLQCGLISDVLPRAIEEVDAAWFEVIEIIAPGGTLVY
ncbi:MAG: hypothetical protein ACREXT_15095, partial [Gammaproteobacteria bacterium]